MARLSLALPGFERCERPSSAPARFCRFQPGRLAQGPDEKCGTRGRTEGIADVMAYPSRLSPLGGEGCPAVANKEIGNERQVGRAPRASGKCRGTTRAIDVNRSMAIQLHADEVIERN